MTSLLDGIGRADAQQPRRERRGRRRGNRHRPRQDDFRREKSIMALERIENPEHRLPPQSGAG